MIKNWIKHKNCKRIIKEWANNVYESFAVKNYLKKMDVCNKCIDKIKWYKGGEND